MHRRLWLAASALLVLAVIVVTLIPPGYDMPQPPGTDKIHHFIAYLLLAIWFTGLVPERRYGVVCAALLALGLGLEGLQAAMQFGRQAETRDMLANAGGVACGIAAAVLLTSGWMRKVDAWLAKA